MKPSPIIVNDVAQLLSLVKGYHDRTMFRGQLRDWPLLPAIARVNIDVRWFGDWRNLHEHILERFKRYGRPHFSEKPGSEIEWLIHAQHYGLPTRLLDWTTNPLKGLFFAVDEPQADEYDGSFWMMDPHGWWEEFSEKNRYGWDKIHAAFFPEHLNPRLIAQEGCFLSFPLPANSKPIKPLAQKTLRQFKIPKGQKAEIRSELRLLGITHRTIYPGLDGVAKSIRINPNST